MTAIQRSLVVSVTMKTSHDPGQDAMEPFLDYNLKQTVVVNYTKPCRALSQQTCLQNKQAKNEVVCTCVVCSRAIFTGRVSVLVCANHKHVATNLVSQAITKAIITRRITHCLSTTPNGQ